MTAEIRVLTATKQDNMAFMLLGYKVNGTSKSSYLALLSVTDSVQDINTDCHEANYPYVFLNDSRSVIASPRREATLAPIGMQTDPKS